MGEDGVDGRGICEVGERCGREPFFKGEAKSRDCGPPKSRERERKNTWVI